MWLVCLFSTGLYHALHFISIVPRTCILKPLSCPIDSKYVTLWVLSEEIIATPAFSVLPLTHANPEFGCCRRYRCRAKRRRSCTACCSKKSIVVKACVLGRSQMDCSIWQRANVSCVWSISEAGNRNRNCAPLFLCCHHWLSPSLWSDRFPLQHATRSSRRHTWPKTRDRTSALLLQNLQAGGGSKYPGPSSQTRRHARKEISYDPSLWRVMNRPVSKSTRLTARKTAPIVDEIQIFSTRN